MTLGSCFHHNLYINPFINPEDNKLTGNNLKVFIKNIISLTSTFQSSFCGFILGPTSIPVSAQVKYTNKDLQKATKLTLESFF